MVAGSILTRVLIDGGSGLNLIFMSTITKMGLDISNKLEPSKAPFYGIVPGNACFPVGTIVLPVTFGTLDNYRTELIKFEVADFESSYHAILERPALAKFMAVPHYVYLLLKMPGKTGVLTFSGDLQRSLECEKEAITYASTNRLPDTAGEVLGIRDRNPYEEDKSLCPKTTRQRLSQGNPTTRRRSVKDSLDWDRAH